MAQVVKQTKATKRTQRSRQRVEAIRKAERKRRLTIGMSAAVIAVLFGVGAFVVLSGGDTATRRGDAAATTEVRPSDPADVTTSGAPRTESLAIGDAVPDFSAPAIGGGSVGWAAYAGKPAVLSVWAPWCPHCQVELPILSRVLDRHPDVGFVTIVTAIGAQPGPTPDGYMRDNGLSFPVAIDDAAGTLATAFGIRGFPMIYFVDSAGTVVQVAEGEVEESILEETVSALA